MTSLLEKEKWKSSIMEFGQILNRIQNLPSLLDAFQLKHAEMSNGIGDDVKGDPEDKKECNGVLNNNKEEGIQNLIDKNPGSIIVSHFFK